jgi:hypothetical protein
MTVEHTPGSWFAVKQSHRKTAEVHSGPTVIARVQGNSDDELLANTCLIACAPRLLSALREIKSYGEGVAKKLSESDAVPDAGHGDAIALIAIAEAALQHLDSAKLLTI